MNRNITTEERCPYKLEPGQGLNDFENNSVSEQVKTGKGSVFTRFTRRSLRKNKVRTLVTIIGIMLSMALTTAVLEGLHSGIQFLINVEIERQGSWEAALIKADQTHKEQLEALSDVTSTQEWRQVGWAETESVNEYKPYLLIESLEDSKNLSALTLKRGRLPENENEIVLPEHLNSNGAVSWDVGDTITLTVGTRKDADGYELGAENPYYPEISEEIADATERTYTVTGIIERIDRALETFECPGYTAFTKGGGKGLSTVFFTLRNPRSVYRFIRGQVIDGSFIAHSDLLTFYGVTGFNNINIVMYGFAGILLFLIAFGSICLIYNAFSISVSERTRQFGILKSTGATKRQIMGSVLYEALFLSVIAIPAGAVVGCCGIGLTLYLLKDAFARMVTVPVKTQIHLILSPALLISAAAVCLLTALISAWIPARRAMRISPIEAIRQVYDVKIKRKNVKTSKLTAKLFGFEGMMASKNFKRNKRRYRSVIFSLSLSIMLFISASALTMYMKQSVSEATQGHNAGYDIRMILYSGERGEADSMKILGDLRAMEGVENAAFVSEAMGYCVAEKESFTQKYTSNPIAGDLSGDIAQTMISLSFADDASFDLMCSQNGLNRDDYYNMQSPQAIVINHLNYEQYDPDSGKFMFYEIDAFNEAMEGKSVMIYDGKPLDGYTFSRIEVKDDGTLAAVFYVNNLSNAAEDGSSFMQTDAEIYLPAEESCYIKDLKIGKLITQKAYFTNSPYIEFVYPYSMIEKLQVMMII